LVVDTSPDYGWVWSETSSADEYVTRMVKVALDSPAFAKAVQSREQDDGDDAALQQMTADQRKLEELAEDYATDVISRKEWLRAREVLEGRLEAARKRLSTNPSRIAALEGLCGDSVAFDEAWEGLSLPRRRAVISAFLERITVHPGVQGRNRFDSQRLESVWRV
jgi:site-specific DNA recombinase